MERLVALLRGINVGKAKRIAMADLRAVVQGLGHTNAATLLNSGNVVFDAARGTPAAHAKALRAAILAQCGVDCEVIVRRAQDVAATLAEHPLRAHADDDARLLVLFVQDDAALADLAPVAARDWSPEALAVGRHAAWLWCANGILESPLQKAVVKALGTRGTARNRATVEKLVALALAHA